MHAVREGLTNYVAQISNESAAVSARYSALVTQTRRIAGGYMHDAWASPPLDNDAGMNITHIDDSELDGPQQEYLDAVKDDLTFLRVAFRWKNPR